MEIESDGNSDVSGSWCLIDSAETMSQDALKRSDSGIVSQCSSKDDMPSASGIDECYEMDEMTLTDPLGDLKLFNNEEKEEVGANASLLKSDSTDIKKCPEKKLFTEESDFDTDGISVISDDEDYPDWKRSAHSNYQNSLNLINETACGSKKSSLETEEMTTSALDEACLTRSTLETEEITHPAMDAAPLELNTFDDGPNRSSITPSYVFITSVLITFIGYMAVTLSSGPVELTSEKVAEIMETLDKLRSENEALRLHLDGISGAYSNLEAKLQSTKSPNLDTLCTKATPDNLEGTVGATTASTTSEDALSLLGKHAEDKGNIQLLETVRKVQNVLNHLKVIDRSDKFKLNEAKLVVLSKKLMLLPDEGDKMQKRFFEIADRIIAKNVPKEKHNVEDSNKLNIVQWYPEEGVIINGVGQPDVTVEIDVDDIPKETARVISIIDEESNFSKPIYDAPKNDKNSKEGSDKNVYSNKYGKYEKNKYKNHGKFEKISKPIKIRVDKNKTKEWSPKKWSRKNETKTLIDASKWLFERKKGRELFRKEQNRADWQFEMARQRRMARNQGEGQNGRWYFRS